MHQHPVHKVRLFTIILSIVTCFAALRGTFDDPVERVLTQIRAYQLQYPFEKVYIHTDRTTYLPGETIWMKSYLFYGITGGADSSSGAILIDLISPNGRKIVLDTRFQSKGGYGEGYLALPDSLLTGRYTLRAYTGWMRNFSEDWYFNKSIDVVRSGEAAATAGGNTSSSATPKGSAIDESRLSTARPDVQFLPEGGQLVAGLASRIAFKAVSPTGVGVDVNGFVLDSRKDTVVGFKSQHLGMGTFPFIPEAGQTYQAYAQIPGTSGLTSYSMPAALTTGYTLQVDNLTNKDNIRVFVSNNLPTATTATPESGSVASPAGTLTVLAQVNGQPVHAARGPVSRKQFMVPIPRSKCPEGIVQI
ncbi:MAG TPA: MG2 domain-containing protein, partial [Fibrella sp.]